MNLKLWSPGSSIGWVGVCACLIALSPGATRAEDPPAKPHAPPAAEKPKDEKKEKEKKPDFPPFDEVSEGHEKTPGFFDLYYDKKKDHLLGVIPKKMIGKDFLISTSISGGPTMTGYMWRGYVVRWEERDKQLILVSPDLGYATADKSTVKDVVARTYTDRILFATKIVSKRGSDPVIDLDKVFKRDRIGISRFYSASMSASLSKWVTTKAFEKNIELTVEAALMRGNENGVLARVHYSISELPEKNGYKPRQADDRVGYFMSAVKDWSKDHNATTVFDRRVHRWHLRKADPDAKVSDVHPDDQIVFYLEKTIPLQYRRYIREGVLMWNDAFAKAGLLNAVAVRQQTDTNEFKDLDPEDVRYNFIRWIVSGRAFAMGPSRTNPKTGQILDADIVIDDSFLRAINAKYERMAAKGPTAAWDPQAREFLSLHPEWAFVPQQEQLLPNTTHYGGAETAWDHEWVQSMLHQDQAVCTYASGMNHEMAFANLILKAEGGQGLSEKYTGQFVKWLVSHEVGHTLGLRHNFKASSWKSLEEILATNGDANVPTSASVMDYCPAMFNTSEDNQKNFYGVGLGPYDEWAIEYGYRHTDDEFKTEKELLKSIASRSAEPGHAYASDEDRGTFAPDPLVNVYDNGDDPIAYAKYRIELVQHLQKDIDSWAMEDGDAYSRLRRAFDALLFEYGRVSRFAGRFVGGQYVTRNHRGDPDEQPPTVVVPVKKQREALDFLVEHLFSDKAFIFDPDLITRLGSGHWRHWASDEFDSKRDYPLHDRIAATQYWPLFHLMNPITLGRIYDAESKIPADEDAMTVPEVMSRVTRAIWSELTGAANGNYSNRKPCISSIRRSLQRTQLNMLVGILLEKPGRTMPADAHSVTRLTLKGLSQQIGDFLAAGDGKLDAFTRAHLDESKARIDKALDADFKL